MAKATATVADWVARSKKGLVAVRNESVKRVIANAQLSDDKGGRMRVDTGFLRSSGQLSLNGMPSGPVRGDTDAAPNQYDFNVSPVVLILASASLDDTLFFGWTANYAIYREYHDGFLRLAVQMWPNIVSDVVAEVKRRYRL
jgi:hypothetical protein